MNAAKGSEPRGPVGRWMGYPVRFVCLLLACAVLLLPACKSTDLGQKGIARAAIEEENARRKQRYLNRLVKAKEPPTEKTELDMALESKFGPEDAAGEFPEQQEEVYEGTGQFINTPKRPEMAKSVGEITLNFENTDIREVVKVILSDMLGKNYILDPRVKGGVTMQTGTPLSLDALLPTLETLLRMNGAALVNVNGTYNVVPVVNAIKGRLTPQLGEDARPLPEGYSVRVLPLQYISVTEMSKILEPFAPEGSIIRVDTLRNILLLAGTSPELTNLVETVRVFDVDWMKGLSVAFFPLEYTSIDEISTDLNMVFGDQAKGPLAGMLRVFPIESANGLLVVTPQQKYLKEIRVWIKRFDRINAAASGAVERLFVYRVRNGQSADLADLLNTIFTDRQQSSSLKKPSLAPGAEPVTIGNQARANMVTAYQATADSPSKGIGANSGQVSADVQIVADEKNNSLLIMATPSDYEKILEALKQLDVTPLQVLVEATIIEVQLTDELEYGIRWSFDTGIAGTDKNQNLALDGSVVPGGFSWTLLSSGGNIKAVISAFAGEGLVRVLSAPSVMVLDNRSARIQVGDEVPIATTQQQSTESTSNLVNNIEYRDTGVVLEVTPRVNPGGLVTMEISQEVSLAVPTTASSLDSPTIQTRKINSTVAVHNDQTVVLGGLIRDSASDTRGGLPGLYKMPFIGNLFGDSDSESLRTELVVILTPQVISSDKDIEDVTEDFRSRLKGLEGRF